MSAWKLDFDHSRGVLLVVDENAQAGTEYLGVPFSRVTSASAPGEYYLKMSSSVVSSLKKTGKSSVATAGAAVATKDGRFVVEQRGDTEFVILEKLLPSELAPTSPRFKVRDTASTTVTAAFVSATTTSLVFTFTASGT